MRTNILLLALLMACFTISSCDEDDLEGVLPAFDVKIVQTEEIPVHIDQTMGVRATFSETTELSIVTDDTKNHLNKIKKLTINKLSYKIIKFSGDATGDVEGSFIVDGQLSLKNNFVVNDAANNGTIYEINDVADLNRIITALIGGQAITVEYGGSALSEADDMDFTVEVTLDATVKIDP